MDIYHFVGRLGDFSYAWPDQIFEKEKESHPQSFAANGPTEARANPRPLKLPLFWANSRGLHKVTPAKPAAWLPRLLT